VTSPGHPYAEFQRALKNGNVWVAEAVARELHHASLEDALKSPISTGEGSSGARGGGTAAALKASCSAEYGWLADERVSGSARDPGVHVRVQPTAACRAGHDDASEAVDRDLVSEEPLGRRIVADK
jgi:hypothetical protein